MREEGGGGSDEEIGRDRGRKRGREVLGEGRESIGKERKREAERVRTKRRNLPFLSLILR